MDGIYEIKLNTPMGAMSGKVTLKTNGENIDGVLEIMGMKNNLNGGRVKGNQCYFKGNIKVECSSRTMDLIKSFDKKTIDVTVVNETKEYQDFQFGIESALSGEEIVLKDGELGI